MSLEVFKDSPEYRKVFGEIERQGLAEYALRLEEDGYVYLLEMT